MTYDEKLIHYATAKRVTAGKITQLSEGEFVTFWAGRVRGKFVKNGDHFKFNDKESALNFARKWRDDCIEEANKRGLLSN